MFIFEISNKFLNNFPDLPTKGLPSKSSLDPGASPTINKSAKTLPSPTTKLLKILNALI